MTNITTSQLKSLWLWARVSALAKASDDAISLYTTADGILMARQGDRTAQWGRGGLEVVV